MVNPEQLEGWLIEAERIFLEGFERKNGIEIKNDRSLVSIYDRKIEDCLIGNIRRNFPNHAIHAEESGKTGKNSENVWYLDPIDGTRSYLMGNPLCGILVGYSKNANVKLGAVSIPALSQRITAHEGTFFQGRGETVNYSTGKKTALSKSLLACTTPEMFKEDEYERFKRIACMCQGVNWGGDCFNYVLLVQGKVDLILESSMKIMDIIALRPVIEAAGGIVSDWRGGEILPNNDWDGTVLATANTALHEKALSLINQEIRKTHGKGF